MATMVRELEVRVNADELESALERIREATAALDAALGRAASAPVAAERERIAAMVRRHAVAWRERMRRTTWKFYTAADVGEVVEGVALAIVAGAKEIE